MKINLSRVINDLNVYSQYGKTKDGGVTRPSFTKNDQLVRNLFIDELKKMGLAVKIDGAANIWGILKGEDSEKGCLVIGSHLDTVPNGGKYDGALGVLLSKEVIQTLIDHSIKLEHDLAIVSFTAEESNDFNLSTFGSRAFTGKLTPEKLATATDMRGRKLSDALASVGGNFNHFSSMKKFHRKIESFIEVHIEQGRRLEKADCSIAVVDKVVGIFREKLTFIGEANHSGTTPMTERKDSLVAASIFIESLEKICQKYARELVGTVGKIHVRPNAANIIPGVAEVIFEIRSANRRLISQTLDYKDRLLNDIRDRRNISIKQEVINDQEPVVLDQTLVNQLSESAQTLNQPCLKLTSMAVHDAAHMADVTKSAMLFVRSKDGKSHCPQEYTAPADIQNVGDVLLQAIVQLDKQLNHASLLE